MKPEIILLAQIYSTSTAYLTRILELQAVTFSKTQGHSDEIAEAFASKVCADCVKDYDDFLRKTLNNLATVYPELMSGSETIEELLKRISLS